MPAPAPRPPTRFGPFLLDQANARLLRDGRPVELVPKAFDVLCQLVAQPGQLFTKDQLLDAVWGHRFVSESVLKSAVKHIRTALEDDARAPRYVETANRRGYRFIGTPSTAPDGAPGPAPAPPAIEANASGPAPLIGRARSLAALAAHWQQACSGRRRLVFVAGEAGIGKTALVDRFAAQAGGARLGRGQCVEAVGANTPYLPVLDALNALCAGDAALPALLRQVAPTWLVQLPWHVPAPERTELHREVAGATPDRMLREMGELLDRLGAAQPVLLVLEDLHWADAVTVQLLDHVARRRGAAQLMLLCTFRPTDAALADHPLGELRRELRLHGLCEELPLEGLSESEVAQFVEQHVEGTGAGRAVPAGFARRLHVHTDGLPLFLASVLAEWAQGGASFGPSQAPFPVPADLLGVIDRQVSRLQAERRELLELAALCPGSFSDTSVAEVLARPPAAVRDALDEMARQQLWVAPAGADGPAAAGAARRFTFRHALYRHAFRQRSGSAQRMEWHRRLADALEREHADQLPEVAAELGLHAEQGGQWARAAAFLAAAAGHAMRRVAPREALALTQRGLALLAREPEAAVAGQRETALALLSQQTLALVATQGYVAPATVDAVRRCLATLEALPLAPAALPVWYGCWWMQVYAGHHGESERIAQLLATRAEGSGSPLAQAVALNMAGVQAYHANAFAQAGWALAGALGHLDEAVQAHGRMQQKERAPSFFPHDPRMEALAHLGHVFELQGHFAAAAQTRVQTLALVRGGRVPLSEFMGLWAIAYAHYLRREPAPMLALCEPALQRMAHHEANPGKAPHQALLAWACVGLGDTGRGVELARQAAQQQAGQGTVMGASATHSWAAAALLAAGELASARQEIETALRLAAGARNAFGLADTLRLQGQLQWRESRDAVAAELSLQHAIATARAQGALLFELHACADLATVWDAMGRGPEAQHLMADVLQRVDAQEGAPALPPLRTAQRHRERGTAGL